MNKSCLGALLITAFSGLVAGQTVTPIQVTATINGTTSTVTENGSLAFTAAAVGRDLLAALTVRNTSSAAITLQGISLVGASEFSTVIAPTFPATIAAGGSVPITIRYLPTTGNRVISQATLIYQESGTGRTFGFSLTGSAPEFALTYFVQPDGSLQALNGGGKIVFPSTLVGSARSAVVIVTNFGSAPGTFGGASISGPDFVLNGAPVFPATVPAGQEVRFFINFTPRAIGTSAGILSLTVGERSSFVALEGIGASSPTSNAEFLVTFFIQPDGVPTSVGTSGGRLVFPPTSVNVPRSATVIVSNRGPGTGTVNSASLTGAGFFLSGLPPIPYVLSANQDLRFTVTFQALVRGTSFGILNLRLGDSTVTLSLEAVATVSSLSVVYSLATDGNSRPLLDGGRLVFDPTPVNGLAVADLAVLNQGSGPGTVNAISVTGNDFQLFSLPLLPVTLDASTATTFRVRFTPKQLGNSTGTLRIDFGDRSSTFVLSGSTAAPDFTVSYIDPRTSSIIPVPDNGAISFPNTAVDSTAAVVISVANRGAGPGFLNSVALRGANAQLLAFQLAELPVFPASVDPARDIRFSIRFTPTQPLRYATGLQLEIGDRVLNVNIDGTGIAPRLEYDLITDQGTIQIAPNGTIPVPDTPVGQTSKINLRVRNSGTIETQITSLQITGAGFTVDDPLVVPFRLAVDGSQRFSLNFTPSQPGQFTGRLRLGSDFFDLAATGIGSRLTYSAGISVPTPVAESGVVVFAPTVVGDKSRVQFIVTNTGTQAAQISSINLASPSTVFVIEGLPVMPLTLDPNASTSFSIAFAPNTAGTLNATMLVNTASFTLSGLGREPVPLPSYTFDGPRGVQEPLQQPPIGLTLASPYPLPLRGTLTLSFVSEVFGPNPGVQFASGGRTANFVIAQGATRAIFENDSPLIRIQTGTVAGNIVVTASFTTAGGLELSPTSPNTLTMSISKLVPRLLDAGIGGRTLTAFNLVLTGYSTTRQLRTMDVQLTAKPGERLTTTSLTLNIESNALIWFQSDTSAAFGGLFTISVPFLLQGELNQDVVSKLESLTVTVSNDVGRSQPVTVPVTN